MALYRLVEAEWENHAKQKYEIVKEKVAADVKKINSFFARKSEETAKPEKKSKR
jgi:hypothetical protein